MVQVFLIIVVIAIAILLAFGMCLIVVIFGHEDDKNVAWIPKVVTVFGLWLAFASVLILPYDVANTQSGGGQSPFHSTQRWMHASAELCAHSEVYL